MNIQSSAPVLVIGAGIMGAGIAQVAAQAGHPVMLFDAREGAATDAIAKLGNSLNALVLKGKLDADAARATLACIAPIDALAQAAAAQIAIEAIVENLEAKRALFRELEALVGADCVLASNTSSISITALANGLQRPERVVGMHFFNPVPVMKLVEVVSGLRTEASVAAAITGLATRWGKTAANARSTPGFIVNRIARPFYAETLALLHERAAEPAVLDACLRGAGFRMGACELMDLIGHDTNFAVTQSVYEANFGDKRFVPSLIQRELVDGGLLGRKSGRGFFDYANAEARLPARPPVETALPAAAGVVLHGGGVAIERWAEALAQAGRAFTREQDGWTGLEVDGAQLRLTDGRAAGLVAIREGVQDMAVFDLAAAKGGGSPGTPLAWAASAGAQTRWQEQAPRWLSAAGWSPMRLCDAAGLVVARTIAMLINEAADAVAQGVCSEADADAAMKLGVNYPAGPFEWLAAWDARAVVQVLDHLDNHYRGERYRVGLGLRQRAWQREALPH
ncbi:MAG: 3-hydroxyacyl-CoA dehydrogenase [Burkholderiales bacterium]